MRNIGKLVSLALIVAVAPLLSACNQADQLCNWLWPPPIDKKATPTDSPQVLKDIEFSRNSSQVTNKDPLLEAWYEIRDDVQKKGVARLVIEGNAARSEKNALTMAETRATAVKLWFEARKPSIPNLQLSTRAGQENKSVVRLIIERERIPLTAASNQRAPSYCRRLAEKTT
jgi:hypothetical protein